MRNARLIATLMIVLASQDLTAQMVIGGSTPAATAVLDLQSTSKGLLPPRLTSVQRNAIVSPATGLTLYNTNLKIVETYNGSLWVNSATGEATGCGAMTSGTTWRDFMCHNLGANTALNPLSPHFALLGHYYQWGRNPQCFGQDGLDEDNPCASPVYGASGPWGATAANDNAGSITSWNINDAKNGSWTTSGGEKTFKDPCPSGYRLPTRLEWDSVLTSNTLTSVGTWSNSTTNFSAGKMVGTRLYLPAAGYREGSDGTLFERGIAGYYWSSTENAISSAWGLKVENTLLGTNSFPRTNGFSVRCIKM